MSSTLPLPPRPAPATPPAPVPIVALDVAGTTAALALLDRLPEADFVKVGLQLFTAAGPDVVRRLRERGLRIFLDLKLHDIPNTVARAVESAAALEAELVTLHASGGRAMLRAAREAADASAAPPLLLAVTVLTSLTAPELAEGWGREEVSTEAEVARLARMAAETGMDGVVASVREAGIVRGQAPRGFRLLTPGIRLAGDSAGDQARVATPEDAARAGVDYVVIGRSVTGAPDPRAAFERVRRALAAPGAGR